MKLKPMIFSVVGASLIGSIGGQVLTSAYVGGAMPLWGFLSILTVTVVGFVFSLLLLSNTRLNKA
jgi:hypothetical protein